MDIDMSLQDLITPCPVPQEHHMGGGQNNGLPNELHIHSPGSCEYIKLQSRVEFSLVISIP